MPAADRKARPAAPASAVGIDVGGTKIAAGLVDEYRLFVYPAVQGRGRSLFPSAAKPALRLGDPPRSFRSGIVLLRYQAG